MRFSGSTKKRLYKYIFVYSLLTSVVLILCISLPRSDAWRETVLFSEIINDEMTRLERARSIFDDLQSDDEFSQRFRSSPDKVKYGVLVVTSDRSNNVAGLNVQYVTETVSALLQEAQKLGSSKVAVLICNVDDGTSERGDIQWISKFIEVVNVHNYEMDRSQNVQYLLQQRSDYAECLDKFLTNIPNAQYYLALEDDAYLKLDFFTKLDYIVEHKLSVGIERGEPKHRSADIGQVKFYVPLLVSRYHSDIESLVEILSMSSVVAGVVALVQYLIYRQHIGFLLPISIIIFSSISFVIIGRNNLFFHRNVYGKDPVDGAGYSIVKPPRCCMAAALYPRHVLPELIDFLRFSHEHQPVDILIADYFERKNLRQFLIYPHLVRHIGYVSSSAAKNDMRWQHWPKSRHHTVLPWIS